MTSTELVQSDQTKSLHHVKDVCLNDSSRNKAGEHMINMFHAKDATCFKFLPVLSK